MKGQRWRRNCSIVVNFRVNYLQYVILLKKPIFMINELVDVFHVSYNTASNRVDMLVKMNIIKKEKEQQRNRIFAAQNYIDIFMKSI